MSGVLKQGGAAVAVARWDAGRPVAVPVRDPQVVLLETEIAALRQALSDERRAAELVASELRADAARAVAAARAAGRDEVVAEDAKRLALIERGVGEAVAAWGARLAEIDALAAELAAMALGKMFGDAPDLRDLVQQTLVHHVERLGRHAVVAVTVSAHDFDEATVPGLSDGIVRIAADLPPGACRISLQLGAVELDPGAQWAVLDAALRAMAA